MTDTNTVIEIETKLMNELAILKDKNVGKERKKQARTNVKRYEKFMNDIDYKHINGHKYPVREVPPETTKEEVLKLIDSVQFVEDCIYREPKQPTEYEKNLEGLMITLEDKGWKEPKQMKPAHLFK